MPFTASGVVEQGAQDDGADGDRGAGDGDCQEHRDQDRADDEYDGSATADYRENTGRGQPYGGTGSGRGRRRGGVLAEFQMART